jgi:hypothetical protein
MALLFHPSPVKSGAGPDEYRRAERLPMKAETIIDDDHVTMLFYPASGIVHHCFHKPTFGKHFRNTLMEGLRVLKQKKATKWLSDDRENSALGAENTEWSQNIWAPQARAAGWSCWAIVLPRELVGQMNMQQFIELNSKRGVTVSVFSDPTRALSWLEQQ